MMTSKDLGQYFADQMVDEYVKPQTMAVTALLFLCHVLLFYLCRRANWLPKSTRAPLYGWSLVLLEPRYTDGH